MVAGKLKSTHKYVFNNSPDLVLVILWLIGACMHFFFVVSSWLEVIFAEDTPLFSKISLDKLLKDARMSPGTSPTAAIFVTVGRGVVVICFIIVIEFDLEEDVIVVDAVVFPKISLDKILNDDKTSGSSPVLFIFSVIIGVVVVGIILLIVIEFELATGVFVVDPEVSPIILLDKLLKDDKTSPGSSTAVFLAVIGVEVITVVEVESINCSNIGSDDSLKDAKSFGWVSVIDDVLVTIGVPVDEMVKGIVVAVAVVCSKIRFVEL